MLPPTLMWTYSSTKKENLERAWTSNRATRLSMWESTAYILTIVKSCNQTPMHQDGGIDIKNARKQKFKFVSAKYIQKWTRLQTVKEKNKTPQRLSTVLGARGKDIKLAAEKKKKRRKDRRTIYTHEKYANNWWDVTLYDLANNLAKNTNCPSDSDYVIADT